MAYGVLYGQTGTNKIPLARTILPINNIVLGAGVLPGGTPNTFICQELGLHQVDFDLNMSSPTNDTNFTLQLWNVTTNTLIQSRTQTAPQQSWPSDMYMGFEWNNTSLTDEYAFYIVPDIGFALSGFALLLQGLNFRAVVQEFGGAGVGPGTVGAIPVFTGVGSIGDSIMTEAGTQITVGGSVRLDDTDTTTFLEFSDGQSVPVSAADEGRIRYSKASQTFQFSENGGAWADLSGVGPGTINRIAKFNAIDTVDDSQITDDGAGEWTFLDGTNQILAVGLVATAFGVAEVAGPDVTIRARDAQTALAANLNGGSLILQGGAPTGTGLRGTVQCPGAGANSIAIGVESLANCQEDVSIGYQTGGAGGGPGTGFNVHIGSAAGKGNLSSYNTAIGSLSLGGSGAGCTNSGNTAVGTYVLHVITGGKNNTGVGSGAFTNLTTGIGNVAIGQFSGAGVTTESRTVVIGQGADAHGDNDIAIGAYASALPISSFSVVIGSGDAGVTYANPTASAQGVIAIGPGAQAKALGCIAIGENALLANAAGTDCTAVGKNALTANTAVKNTAFGSGALDANTSGLRNTAVGFASLGATVTVNDSTALGYQALTLATGGENTAVGSKALDANTTGAANTAVGLDALGTIATGAGNTAVGHSAGLSAAAGINYGVSFGHTANATANYAVSAGANSTASGAFSIVLGSGDAGVTYANPTASAQGAIAIGAGATVSVAAATGLGQNAVGRVESTVNVSGLNIARKDSAEADYWLYFGSRTNIVYGPEVSLLATGTTTITVPVNCHCWVEEVGLILTDLALDGGALTVQPTCSFGVTGTNNKHLAATLMTLLTAEYNRERFTTLLTDVGETSFTMEITVSGTIAGGGGSEAYKARPYWVIRVVEDE